MDRINEPAFPLAMDNNIVNYGMTKQEYAMVHITAAFIAAGEHRVVSMPGVVLAAHECVQEIELILYGEEDKPLV